MHVQKNAIYCVTCECGDIYTGETKSHNNSVGIVSNHITGTFSVNNKAYLHLVRYEIVPECAFLFPNASNPLEPAEGIYFR